MTELTHQRSDECLLTLSKIKTFPRRDLTHRVRRILIITINIRLLISNVPNITLKLRNRIESIRICRRIPHPWNNHISNNIIHRRNIHRSIIHRSIGLTTSSNVLCNLHLTNSTCRIGNIGLPMINVTRDPMPIHRSIDGAKERWINPLAAKAILKRIVAMLKG